MSTDDGHCTIIKKYGHKPLKYPVFVLIDNDDGANGAKRLFSVIKQNFEISVGLKSDDPFYYITDNLYLVKTVKKGKSGKSCIEDCFEQSLLKTKSGEKAATLRKTAAHRAVTASTYLLSE